MTDTTILVAIGAVLLVLFPALGWKSLKYLREAPDIPHKREMIWGAKYWGLIYDLVAVVPVVAGPLMVHYHLPWAMTVATAWIGLIPLATAAGMITYWPGIGHGVALSIWGARRGGGDFDWEEFVKDFERKRGAWWNKAAIAVFLVFIPVWGYFTFTRMIPAEGMLQATRWSDRVETEIADATQEMPVKDIIVSREIFSKMGKPVPAGRHDNAVLVELAANADDGLREEALARVESILEKKRAPGEWYLRAWCDGDNEPVTRMWRGAESE